ncbi:MAG: hypothetical protein ACLQDY_26810 [Streptosporangiaceae bacterium]
MTKEDEGASSRSTMTGAAWPAAPARLAADPRGAHARRDERPGEHEVDAHAEVLLWRGLQGSA